MPEAPLQRKREREKGKKRISKLWLINSPGNKSRRRIEKKKKRTFLFSLRSQTKGAPILSLSLLPSAPVHYTVDTAQ